MSVAAEITGLMDVRHDRFCQAISEGMSPADAYAWAGYRAKPSALSAAASRLIKRPDVQRRISLLMERRKEIERRSTEIAAERLAITKERVLAEIAKIAFADARKAIRWHGTLVQEKDNPDGGDTLVVKNTYNNQVQLIPSDEIDDDTAGAIAEVSQNSSGGVKIKFHDKLAALINLGKHLGLFVEKHEHSGKNGAPIELKDVSKEEAARRIAFMFAVAATQKQQSEQLPPPG